MKDQYLINNKKVWEAWAKEDFPWCQPISHDDYKKAIAGEWNLRLTPVRYVPKEWFPEIEGKNVLGLASGGGQQMPVFVAHGANVTLLDFCEHQIELEREIASRESYEIKLYQRDMTEAFPFKDGEFDLIFMPLSAQFVRDINHVWKECHRVLKPNGLLMAGFVNPMEWLFDDEDDEKQYFENPIAPCIKHRLPYDPIADGTANNNVMTQFSHSLESLLGWMMRAGMVITDLYEDTHHGGLLREYAQFSFAVKAQKILLSN